VKFLPAPIEGAYIIEIEPVPDERGFFARSWCQEEFRRRGLNPTLVQCNISFNRELGTLRGMHYQVAPHEEAKLVRCASGALYDVIVDLRPESRSFRKWFAAELTAANHKMLYVPEGVAHGFQTLAESTEVFYQMTEAFRGECARGVRWNDRAFGIRWPVPGPILSPRDQSYPDYLA
jgi:dTDP-4-dehydrorhamnose 3,5-epimerase